MFEKTLSDAVGDISGNAIEQYENSKNMMSEFKTKLEEVIKVVKNDDEDKPFVFFIDELDRCRPDFAVELLEKAKHFFSVPGVVFVLSVDKEQLGHAVRSIYDNVEVDGYLKRFIDIDYKLPVNMGSGFSKHLFDKFGITHILKKINGNDNRILSYDCDLLVMIFNQLSSVFDLSLRTQEKCFSRIASVIHFSDQSKYIVVELLILLIFLKEIDNQALELIFLKLIWIML